MLKVGARQFYCQENRFRLLFDVTPYFHSKGNFEEVSQRNGLTEYMQEENKVSLDGLPSGGKGREDWLFRTSLFQKKIPTSAMAGRDFQMKWC